MVTSDYKGYEGTVVSSSAYSGDKYKGFDLDMCYFPVMEKECSKCHKELKKAHFMYTGMCMDCGSREYLKKHRGRFGR